MRRLLAGDHKFAIQTVSGLLLLKHTDIICFQFIEEVRSWQMLLVDRAIHKLRSSTTAKNLLDMNRTFVQTNQNCILNIEYLMSIENGTLQCKLYPPFQDVEISFSRRYYKKVKDMLDII